MENDTRIEEIQRRLEEDAYNQKSKSDANPINDLRYVLKALRDKVDQVETLQKKNDLLSQHVLELTQEMENIRADFGGGR